MVEKWDFERLMGYLNTWSAVKCHTDQIGENPLDLVHDDLRAAWGAPEQARRITWPLATRLWVK